MNPNQKADPVIGKIGVHTLMRAHQFTAKSYFQ